MNTNDHDAPILLSPPHITGEERRFVEDAFRTNWIAPLGPNVDGFEREMCAHLGGSISACATSSGTAAIHLGLILLGVMPGDAVLCSSFTFVATANPIQQLGAKPIFIGTPKTTSTLTKRWRTKPRKQGTTSRQPSGKFCT